MRKLSTIENKTHSVILLSENNSCTRSRSSLGATDIEPKTVRRQNPRGIHSRTLFYLHFPTRF